MSDPVLVTGSAGFIGFHTARRLLERGERVIGLDNLNAYYDPALKQARLAQLQAHPNYRHHTLDLADRDGVAALFAEHQPRRVVHLAAQAGVRYSLEAPETYVDSNVVGFLSILEGCRAVGAAHLVFASTSSVFGANRALPFSVRQPADHPLTVYAATKLANEAMAHSYAHLFGFPATGLRFFTVYGPWGRPDMALFKFVHAILNGDSIDLYNQGQLSRDFTHVDDIVEGIVRIADSPPAGDAHWQGAPDASPAPYRLFNIGNGSPVRLLDFVDAIESALGKRAIRNMLPMQPGDVLATWADTRSLFDATGYRPRVGLKEGVDGFVRWYRDYYRV